MWVCTPGSVLMPGLLPKQHIPVEHPEWILQVRTRRRVDLERLVERFIPEGDCSEIHATPGMDYNFRLYCSKETFAQACFDIAMDIDYIKFKEQSEIRHPGPDGKLLHGVYTSIWSTLTRLGTPYVGDGTGDISKYGAWGSYENVWGQAKKPVAIKKNSLAEKVWHLLVELDNGKIDHEECFQKIAKFPEHVWVAIATPTESLMIRRIVSENKTKKQTRDRSGRFAKVRNSKVKI